MKRTLLQELLPIGFECEHSTNPYQVAYISGLKTNDVSVQIISSGVQAFITHYDDFKKALSVLKDKGYNTAFDKGTSKFYEWRRIRAMTQTELAELIGVSQNEISRRETGKFTPKTDKLLLIADALQCDIKDLI